MPEAKPWEWTDADDAMLAALTRGDRLVAELQAHARAVAYHQARLLESMAAIVDEYMNLSAFGLDVAVEGSVAEVRAALSLTRRAAESDLDLAWSLRERLPMVLDALRRGDIDLRRAWVLVDSTSHLGESVARYVVTEALSRAEGRTAGQLRALVRRLSLDVDAGDALRRHESALADRRVFAELTVDSTATITASDLPAERVASIMDRLTRIARSLGGADEQRNIDQLRADVFLDLLEGRVEDVKSVLDIRVDLTTLMDLDQRAADLGGFGPVVADIARQVASGRGSSWRFAVTDQAGVTVHTGITRRRPDAALRRQIEARDQSCVFPGCRHPAGRCDLDHRIRVADGGATDEKQLAPLCRHDHVVRHRHGWSHLRNRDGSYVWTSPLGVEYTRPPP